MTTLAWRILIIALLLGALFGAGWHFGASSTQRRWDAATASQERDYLAKVAAAQATTATWQAKADTASRERDDALQNLTDYRTAHPVHVSLCVQPPKVTPALPGSPGTEPQGTGSATVVQPASQADIGPELDALAGLADQINESYRQCRAVYQALNHVP